MYAFKDGEKKVFNPEEYRLGSQKQRILWILQGFDVVPLPFFLRTEPRIACYSAAIAVLRKAGYIIDNETIEVIRNGRLEKNSFYQLRFSPGDFKEQPNKINDFIDMIYGPGARCTKTVLS